MEQLVLYVKALRALNLSLLFAQGEIRVGHLKPSNAVKNGNVLVHRKRESPRVQSLTRTLLLSNAGYPMPSFSTLIYSC